MISVAACDVEVASVYSFVGEKDPTFYSVCRCKLPVDSKQKNVEKVEMWKIKSERWFGKAPHRCRRKFPAGTGTVAVRVGVAQSCYHWSLPPYVSAFRYCAYCF